MWTGDHAVDSPPRAPGRPRHTATVLSILPTGAGRSGLDEVVWAQVGVLSRRQLSDYGVTKDGVRSQIRARRWRLVGPRVVVLHRGPLSRAQRLWVAVLHGGRHAALAAWTAAEIAGLTGFERAAVHIVVPRGTLVPRLRGLVVHESRRLSPEDIHPAALPRRVRSERAVLDAASWSVTRRGGCALAAAAVAQGIVPAHRLETALHNAGAIRYRRALAYALADIDGGSRSLAEIDFIRLCRQADLPAPRQQVIRLVGGRRRYLDAEWLRADGVRVVAEVDGGQHRELVHWQADMDRQNEITLDGSVVLRFPSAVLRVDRDRCLWQLARALTVPAATLSVVSGHG